MLRPRLRRGDAGIATARALCVSHEDGTRRLSRSAGMARAVAGVGRNRRVHTAAAAATPSSATTQPGGPVTRPDAVPTVAGGPDPGCAAASASRAQWIREVEASGDDTIDQASRDRCRPHGPARRDTAGDGGSRRRLEDRLGRHGLDARLDRPRDDHAAGPRPVLRRARPPQERPLDDHAQLLRPRPRQRRLGHRRLQPRLRSRRERLGDHRRPRLRRLHERRHGAEHGLRGDDPIPPVRRLPAHVRGDHARPHHRRVRRAQAVRRLRPVHHSLVDPRLLADRPLGLVGRRLALQGRRARLRRRDRRPHQLRRIGPHRRDPHRQAGDERGQR